VKVEIPQHHWRDLILFYEYFHGDNGAGIGASHQTGWTALIAPLLDIFARADAHALLELDREQLRARVVAGRSAASPSRAPDSNCHVPR
jgi:hypothetical protein